MTVRHDTIFEGHRPTVRIHRGQTVRMNSPHRYKETIRRWAYAHGRRPFAIRYRCAPGTGQHAWVIYHGRRAAKHAVDFLVDLQRAQCDLHGAIVGGDGEVIVTLTEREPGTFRPIDPDNPGTS